MNKMEFEDIKLQEPCPNCSGEVYKRRFEDSTPYIQCKNCMRGMITGFATKK